jgi:hypothetical protein
MKRLCRWLFNGLTALSAMLWIATIILWMQSYFGQLGYNVSSRQSARTFQNVRGGFQYVHEFTSSHFDMAMDVDVVPGWYSGHAYNTIISHPRLGFGFARDSSPSGWHITVALIPAYAPFAAFAVMPVSWLRQFRSNRSRMKMIWETRCVKCGYDLRATPDCCPECGTVPANP